MGENLAHLCMLGGYGVSSIEQTYRRTGVYVLPSFNDLVERGVWQEMATRIVCRVFEKPGGEARILLNGNLWSGTRCGSGLYH